ncbi:MAG TPA: SHOCT domain-containing protein [Gammaproteobacteria bacterium]
MEHGDWMFFGGGYMWLLWVLIIAVIVILLTRLTGNNNSGSSVSKMEETPLVILKKRFARGEIDEDEFKRRSRELEK